MIYIYCFLASVAFAYLASRSKGKIAVFLWSAMSILVLCVLGGLREPFMTIDVKVYAWPHFMKAREAPSFVDMLKLVHTPEIGYLAVCYLSCKIFDHLNWALFFYQLIAISCFYVGAYKHRKILSLPLLMLAFCFLQYSNTYMFMRQSMACGIVFMGVNYLEEKKYLRFSLYILVASLFHTSAIICFPLLIGVHMVMTSEILLKNDWLNFFVVCGTSIILIYLQPLMFYFVSTITNSEKYLRHVSSFQYMQGGSGGRSRITFPIIMLLILTLYRKRAGKILVPITYGGGASFFHFTLLVHLIYYVFIQFFEQRIFLYSEYMYLILVASCPKFVKEKHLKVIALFGVIAYMATFWLVYYIIRAWQKVWPYESIL